ncbi:hypothetical protein RHSIM_Rhsim08G0096500 [Rhododendron simsii]|uniref:RING-type E3 ubiquitin transferase n=1 Tax=Rhododendron simsii TaxID=118357 RepID=A0A834GHV1_RHOSS|nr:hypothetical protein RHSIM_Rhsim08G0096500 [Rhododendron simsii]
MSAYGCLMEISLTNVVLNSISSFSELSSHDNITHEPALKYYRKVEEILKLLKPVLDVVFDAGIASEELFQKASAELGHTVNELKELFGNFHRLTSKIYFGVASKGGGGTGSVLEVGVIANGRSVEVVLQAETLISKIWPSVVEIFEWLKYFDCLSLELNASSLELCVQKILQIGVEQTPAIISQTIREQVDGSGPSSESLAKFEDHLGLRSNLELLIEAVALEKLKKNAEQAEENSEADYFDQMIALVTHMHEGLVKVKQSESSNHIPTPADFCCPLSLELMRDPVFVASGQTYERDFIIKWIDLGLTVCPKTWQTMAHTNLIPNYTMMMLIANWCERNNVKLPDPMKSISFNRPCSIAFAENIALKDIYILPHSKSSKPESTWSNGSPGNNLVSSSAIETRADLSGVEAQVRNLVEDLKGTSFEVKRTATAELRLLAKRNMDNRIVIANSGAIDLLVDLLHSTDSKIQEESVTALLYLSINHNSKTSIADAGAIEPLIHVLETGTPEAKENSAATLFSLSVIEDNKVRIGRSGAIKPLVELLGHGTPRGKKYAATALFSSSTFHENKPRIVEAGAVKYLVELMHPTVGMVDKAVAVLANLATIPEGRTAIGQEGGIPVLVEVIELGSARGKEHAAAALLQLCINRRRFCSLVLQEGAVPPLVALSQTGTRRAQEKALALLSFLRNQLHGNVGRG